LTITMVLVEHAAKRDGANRASMRMGSVSIVGAPANTTL
jgi:hypothetical protein